jgi:hypothetical protein
MNFLLVYINKASRSPLRISLFKKQVHPMRTSSHCQFGMIKKLLLFALLIGSTTAMAQADNRYCQPGDTPDFGAAKDGPASLPNRCINTALTSSPSRGKEIKVSDPSGVEAALQSASCGDTIVLQAGKTFAPFTLPPKKCDAAHWITIRTSAESDLPPEGTRLTPCYAGQASLPDMPPYVCPTPKNVLARVELKAGAGAITVAEGANHYRIIGLELTRTAGTGTVYALIRFEDRAVDHVIIDRSWIHGTPLDENVRGVYLGGSSYVGIVDSYFNDFHCIAMTGACTDAQAINGGNSDVPAGVYKIVNNYLEGAAENVMFGGARGSQVPSDIEIRRNYMFKPLSWQPGRPNFIGKNFIVKNLFEIKNAERLLFEGNVLENCWGGFSQVGWGIVLTPRGNWAADRDITIRYNTISHVGSGFQIAASQHQLSTGQWVDSIVNEHVSIHDVTVDDMDAAAYNGDGIEFQISSGLRSNAPLNSVVIKHVTVHARGKIKSLMIVGVAPENPRPPFAISFTDNIAPAGKFSVWSTGLGTCAKSGQPAATFENCWKSFQVTNNVIIDYPNGQGPWPSGNFQVKDIDGVGFQDPNSEGADYRLSAASRFKGKASDGKDVGADIDAIRAASAGVR